MSRRWRNWARYRATSRAGNEFRSEELGPHSPLLQGDNNQFPTTSYASVNYIDAADYRVQEQR